MEVVSTERERERERVKVWKKERGGIQRDRERLYQQTNENSSDLAKVDRKKKEIKKKN